MAGKPDHHSLAGRLGAFRQHARHDCVATTAAAREAFLGRFEQEVDPERQLPELERQRRAAAARNAYFTRLALWSARARRKRRPVDPADAEDVR